MMLKGSATCLAVDSLVELFHRWFNIMVRGLIAHSDKDHVFL